MNTCVSRIFKEHFRINAARIANLSQDQSITLILRQINQSCNQWCDGAVLRQRVYIYGIPVRRPVRESELMKYSISCVIVNIKKISGSHSQLFIWLSRGSLTSSWAEVTPNGRYMDFIQRWLWEGFPCTHDHRLLPCLCCFSYRRAGVVFFFIETKHYAARTSADNSWGCVKFGSVRLSNHVKTHKT